MTLVIIYMIGFPIFWIAAAAYMLAHDHPYDVPSIGDILMTAVYTFVISIFWPVATVLFVVAVIVRRFIARRLAVAEREAARPVQPMSRAEFDRLMKNVMSEKDLEDIERRVRERGIE